MLISGFISLGVVPTLNKARTPVVPARQGPRGLVVDEGSCPHKPFGEGTGRVSAGKTLTTFTPSLM